MQQPPSVDAVGSRGPRRPVAAGTKGQQVQVSTNHFEMTLKSEGIWNHYDAVNPATLSRKSREALIHRMQTAEPIFNPRGVFDSMNSFYIRADSGVPNHFQYTRGQGHNQATVTITLVRTVRFSSIMPHIRCQAEITPEGLSALQLLNIVAVQSPKEEAIVVLGKGRTAAYDLNDTRVLGGGLISARGFIQSVRPGWQSLYVNVDMTVGVMYREGSLMDNCRDFLQGANLNNLTPEQLRKLSSHFKGVKVLAKHLDGKERGRRRVFTIKSISDRSAYNYKFKRNGEETTVQKYFEQHHAIKLAHLRVPCVIIGENAYPMELLKVTPGQLLAKTKKITSAQNQVSLKHASVPPSSRLAAIKNSLTEVLSFGSSDYLTNNSIEIALDEASVAARVLQPPPIQYGGGIIEPENGQWNMKRVSVLNPGTTVSRWCFINFTPQVLHHAAAQAFLRELTSVFRGQLVQGDALYREDDPSKDVQKILAGIKATAGVKGAELLVICAMSNLSTSLKVAIKHWGDIIHGIATQIVDSSKVASNAAPGARKGSLNQYCNNLALKINSKLGGTNCAPVPNNIAFLKTPTIIMGADVAHPSPGAPGPSTVSLVSSVDGLCSVYVAQVAIQQARQEMIEGLDEMVKRAIDALKEYNGDKRPPRMQVLFYRDGISEGQFAQALAQEALAVQNGLIKAGYNGSNCRLTFIVVGKKHQFRMFPQNGGDRRSGNCASGTVVEATVTSPWWNDFYLLSQAGLIGTSRPAHYSVLRDDSQMSADQLQEISFALCHFYSRATKTVSIPSVVYYADLVCSRAAFHYATAAEPSDWSAGNTDRPLEHYQALFRQVHPTTRRRMYWM